MDHTAHWASSFCPNDAVEPRQLLIQHVTVEKEEGAQRLVLRGRMYRRIQAT
jgi:hypothetical protein